MKLLQTKKAMAIICAAVIAVVGSCSALTYFSVSAYIDESALKEANSKAEITEAFHDQGYIYMSPAAPSADDDITIRLRTDRYNVTKAQIQYTLDKGTSWTAVNMKYEKRDETGYYDLWKGVIPKQREPFFYRFSLANEGDSTVYYGTSGIKSYQMDFDEMFYVIPGFSTPEWSQGATWYYTHTAHFYNADTTNDIYREFLMYDSPYGNDILAMHRGSGDLKGIAEKLDYIESLGAEVLSLGPYFSSADMFGFGIDNYASVETALGNESNLIALINEVHSRNMKITTDMIVSYAVYNSKYFNMTKNFPTIGAYQSQNSKYSSLFNFPQWPYNFVKIWGSAGFNVSNSDSQKLLYKNNDSIIQRYMNEPYGLDGYRFDAEESVGNLGFDYDPETIWKDIYSSIKSANKDFLVLSENPTGIADQYNTLFDSSWQKNGYFAVKDWFEGSFTASQMIDVLQKNLINTARPRALSSYNFIGQHDVPRLFSDTAEQRDAISALLLLQFTFLGSPVIYFGDEIGLTNGLYEDQSANPFNWDESTWDYNILNLVRSLGSLRKEYSCLKDGVIKIGDIEDSNLFLSFGRFDENGSVITLCNQQSSPQVETVNVSRYNVKDGTVLNDYLTGNKYKVKDGKISLSVIPGGTVLVTGKQVSDYRGEYTVNNKKTEIIKNNTADFTITSKAKNFNDTGYLLKKIYNNSQISAKIDSQKKAAAVLFFRNSDDKDSAYYEAEISKGKVTVNVRKKDGGKAEKIIEAEIPENSYVKLVRENNNIFSFYYTDDSEKAYTLLKNSKVIVNANEKMLAGITSLEGTVNFTNVICEANDCQIYDNFDSETLGSLFTNGDENISLKDGKLEIDAEKSQEFLKTNAHSSDFTFKTEITSFESVNDENLAGVMAYSTDDNYVFAGRCRIDGKNYLCLARMHNGKMVIKAKVEEKDFDKPVVIQLQRVGSMFSAVYSYDQKNWQQLGYNLYSNMTGINTGLVVKNAKAEFEFASFGNAVNDNATTNYPISLQEFANGYANDTVNIESDMFAFVGGDWEDIGPGYRQDEKDGTHLLFCRNKIFGDLRAEATFSLEEGNGSVGIIFAKNNDTANTNDCYKVALSGDSTITLYCNNKKIKDAKIEIPDEEIRILVQKDNGFIHVFAGENADLAISVEDNTLTDGYVAFYTENASGKVINMDITELSQDWGRNSSVFGSQDYIELIENNAMISLTGAGITNGILSFSIDNQSNIEDKEANIMSDASGVLLCGNYEQRELYGGVKITYSYFTGRIEASEFGKVIGSVDYNEPKTKTAVNLLVKYSEGNFHIYADGSRKSVLSVKSAYANGGGVSFCSDAGTVRIINFDICDITNLNSFEESEVWKNWISENQEFSMNVVKTRGNSFTDSFDSYQTWIKNMYKLKRDDADWYIEDGVLKTDSVGANWNFATVSSGVYGDVDVSVKVRMTDFNKDTYSSISLAIGKEKLYSGNDDTGCTIKIYGNGSVYLFDNYQKTNLNGWNDYVSDPAEFVTLRLVKKGGTITAFLNGQQIYHGTNNSVSTGFIALGCDYASAEFDDLAIN